jgi:hypothetical protein
VVNSCRIPIRATTLRSIIQTYGPQHDIVFGGFSRVSADILLAPGFSRAKNIERCKSAVGTADMSCLRHSTARVIIPPAEAGG